MSEIRAKYEALKRYLNAASPLALAFSGGVDSSFLLAACLDSGADFIAATVESEFQPARDRRDAFELGQSCVWLRINVDVLSIEGVAENPPERCYICKRGLFEQIKRRVGARTLIDGSNADDLSDYRPGMRAWRELGVKSPLMELGWTKAEIRAMSRELGLKTADKPAMACLATRIPTGEVISAGKLRAIDASEEALRDMGFRQVRVRAHGEIARIELDKSELARAAESADKIVSALTAAGFRRVMLDLSGYTMGSMNEKVGGAI